MAKGKDMVIMIKDGGNNLNPLGRGKMCKREVQFQVFKEVKGEDLERKKKVSKAKGPRNFISKFMRLQQELQS